MTRDALRADLRAAGQLAAAELRQSVRRVVGDSRQLIAIVVLVLSLGWLFVLSLPATYLFGRQVAATGELATLRAAPTYLLGGALVMGAYQTVQAHNDLDASAFVLTTIHPRAATVGLFVDMVGKFTAWFGAPLALTLGAFAAGVDAPTVFLGVVLVGGPLAVCGLAWGHALGFAALHVIRRLPRLKRLAQLLGVVLMIAAVIGSQLWIRESDAGLSGVGSRLSAASVGPLAAVVDLALLGSGLGRVAPVGVLVVGLALASAPLGLLVAHRLAARLWLRDGPDGPALFGRVTSPATPDDGPTDQPATPTSAFAPPGAVARWQSTRLAWGYLLRSVREPRKRAHLLVVVFASGPIIGPFVTGDGPSGLLFAGAAMVFGVFLAGGTFGLNPLGEDRGEFPLLLTSLSRPVALLRARALAGLAVGLPIVLGTPVVALGLGAAEPLYAVGLAVTGLFLCLAAAGLGVGLGCAVPVYEPRNMWGFETIAPSTIVLVGYMLVVTFGSGIGLFLLPGLVPGLLGGEGLPGPLWLLATFAYVLLTAAVPAVGYRSARRRYRDYSLD
jgi:ABC-2 type transport system permease protein